LRAGKAYLHGLAPRLSGRILPVGTCVVVSKPLGVDQTRQLIPCGVAVCDNNFLRRRRVMRFPQLAGAAISHAWGDFVDSTMNQAADFGRSTGAPQMCCWPGFSGHCLALTGLANQWVAAATAGDSQRFDVFCAARAPPVSGRPLVAHPRTGARHDLVPLEGCSRMTTAPRKPVVLVPACNVQMGHHPFHITGKKYTDAVRLAGCMPLIVPTAQADELDALLALADAVLLTGSPSNVHPRNFDEDVYDPSLPLDPERDAWTLPLIPKALALGMPLFTICRGTQEANVALGGSLHQAVQEVAPHIDHRAPVGQPGDVTYADAHEVLVVAGGVLAGIVGRPRFQVNSAHSQAVKRLAPGLRVEARAPDGVVEAFSFAGATGFNLCVQWHPEWQAAANPVSMQLLLAFGRAAMDYRDRRNLGLGRSSA
jgi:putative glutamine amidotransferase